MTIDRNLNSDVPGELDADVPREHQTIHLTESRLESLREWAIDGTGLTAAVRATDPDGRIAFVKNAWSDGWILPGGGVEPGETPIEAARRELREETGLCGSIGEPLVVVDQTYCTLCEDEPWFSAQYIVYAASADGTIPEPESLGVKDSEIRAARWFDRLPAELHDGDVLRPHIAGEL